ncbi:MAG: hemerythrin domain-containing protein [Nitrosopumilaceae archaeon]|nr:hemerythrin domain-containing protein [Nitrosopumilaceae archaeon]
MSTASLRRDHDLIEKVLKSMAATVQLLESGKAVPAPILNQVIDFTKNFTDVCHHAKEEESLFPALQSVGVPSRMGPIPVMLMEHRQSREIAAEMEGRAREYLESGEYGPLATSMRRYVQHVTEHLWKENNRLFVMAEARLQRAASKVSEEMDEIERRRLEELGRERAHYERIVSDLDGMVRDVSRSV